MKREDIQKLVGGYATGTLTPEEQEALFAAALEDQQLFEELLAEEPVREALADPSARAALLAALPPAHPSAPSQPWYYRDVHSGIIAASVSAILIAVAAVEFWPVRVAAPINVVARPEMPQPSKSVLPNQLPVPFRSVLPAAPALPAVPNTPGIVEARRALDQLIVAQNSPARQPSDVSVASAKIDVAPPAVAPRALFRQVAPVVRAPVRYTILRKTPDGVFVPVEAGEQLNPADETAVRLEPAESGYLYVFERSAGAWRRIATEQVIASEWYTIPREGVFRDEGSGPRELQVVFSREPEAAPDRALSLRPVAGEPARNAAVAGVVPTLFITLRYPQRLP